MEYLKKEEVFFERDETGKLLPVDAVLELLPDKPKIRVIPMNKGEISSLMSMAKEGQTDADADIDILIKHCANPKFTEEDRESLKTASKVITVGSIVTAILSVSTGIEQKQIIEEGRKKVLTEAEQFQKK